MDNLESFLKDYISEKYELAKNNDATHCIIYHSHIAGVMNDEIYPLINGEDKTMCIKVNNGSYLNLPLFYTSYDLIKLKR